METITLFRTAQGWMSKHSDPQVRELFGTDTIPTAFTEKADSLFLTTQRLNPWCDVRIEITSLIPSAVRS